MKYIEIKSEKNETTPAPIQLPENDKDDEQQEVSEVISVNTYRDLLAKEINGNLNYNEGGMLTFFKNKFGRI
ncbi:hypothetical protein [Spirosoma arboris]|uniref:hypothetical protein n=1 Tax=Spirosoma arboris TaxID=2682092 RepID=UPI001D12BCBE|nr:hypothetical protein [Spirosoma arboris]